MLDEIWKTAISAAELELGQECVNQWIRPVGLKRIDNDLAVLATSTSFLADWVERNYGRQLLRHIHAAAPEVNRINLTVSGGMQRKAAAAVNGSRAMAAPVQISAEEESSEVDAADSPGDELRSSLLNPRFTFSSFVVGKPNELAYAAARRVSETAHATSNPVFLYGGVGLGKTHLMHAIGWHLAEHHPDRKVLYLSAEQFMYRFIQALRFRDTLTFKQQFRAVDVLMIDDVQFIADTDSTQEEFFHTFNALIDQKKQIVISADRSPDRIDGLEDRIRSRLQQGLVADIHPANYELRLGILHQKIEDMRRTDPEVEIDPKVLEFLAQRISSNVRVLEGALIRLFAFAAVIKRRIDLEVTQECLADLLRTVERKVTIEEIKRVVSNHYNLRMSDLTSARRSRVVARPRQVAMYLCKMLTQKSLPEIGRGFGNRDHTTVMHAVKVIEKLKDSDSQMADDIEMLRRSLEGR
ncbi:chromosomal replication initiator protein DnaA [Rhodobacteraceae bacterium NNCM2]|nr:chromosomal replication initiator protein DnaA [Coraliihabitans acroporae]